MAIEKHAKESAYMGCRADGHFQSCGTRCKRYDSWFDGDQFLWIGEFDDKCIDVLRSMPMLHLVSHLMLARFTGELVFDCIPDGTNPLDSKVNDFLMEVMGAKCALLCGMIPVSEYAKYGVQYHRAQPVLQDEIVTAAARQGDRSAAVLQGYEARIAVTSMAVQNLCLCPHSALVGMLGASDVFFRRESEIAKRDGGEARRDLFEDVFRFWTPYVLQLLDERRRQIATVDNAPTVGSPEWYKEFFCEDFLNAALPARGVAS